MTYLSQTFDRFSEWIADHLGKPVSFALAVSSVLLWAAWGPFANFSQTWQLIINTGTTIATFLMVFLLQNTQNRDTGEVHDMLRELLKNQRNMMALQRKLNERIMTLELTIDAETKIT